MNCKEVYGYASIGIGRTTNSRKLFLEKIEELKLFLKDYESRKGWMNVLREAPELTQDKINKLLKVFEENYE